MRGAVGSVTSSAGPCTLVRVWGSCVSVTSTAGLGTLVRVWGTGESLSSHVGVDGVDQLEATLSRKSTSSRGSLPDPLVGDFSSGMVLNP